MRLFSSKRLTRRKAILSVIVLTGLLLAWIVFRTDEPTYHGRSLSSWIDIYRTEPAGSAKQQHAQYAINQIGTNAVPWLLKWLTNEPPAWKVKLAFERIPWLVTSTNRLVRQWFWKYQDGDRSLPGFRVLGPKASSAVPTLEHIIDQHRGTVVPNRTALQALGALAYSGTDGLPKLLDLATGGDEWVILEAQQNILEMGTNAFPGILTYTNCLIEDDPRWRIWGLRAIGNSGQNAKPFASSLVNVLSDPDAGVREAATNALRKVDPQILDEHK
jgi:hypothetical protein